MCRRTSAPAGRSRRAHGVDAALKLARGSYLAGFAGTSNVLAGRLYGVPVFGTMAHSFIEAHHQEADALEAFAREFPGTTLLIDTYDVDACVETVIQLQRRLDESQRIGAVRIDSGDLGAQARQVRQRLDHAGLEQVKIFLSGGLDERKIADLVERGYPVDGFGVGTRVGVSADVPYYDCAYKLVAYDGEPRMKLSGSSPMLPGRKQVFRRFEAGVAVGDTIGLHEEQHKGEPVLRCVMRGGEPVAGAKPTTEAVRRHAAEQIDGLSPRLRQLAPADPPYPVAVSDALEAERHRLRQAISG